MGIIPRTMMPFMPNRAMTSVIDWSTRTPTDGAAMNSDRSSMPMMMRAQPAFSTNPRILFMTVHLDFFLLKFPDQEHTKLFGRCGWWQDAGDMALVDDGDAVANGPQLFKLGRDHDDGRAVLAVVGAKCLQHEHLGPDVDAARRLRNEQDVWLHCKGFGEADLLLVAT